MRKTEINADLCAYFLEFEELTLDAKELFSFMGYEADGVPSHLSGALQEIYSKAADLCELQAVIRYADFAIPEKGKIQLDQTIFDCGGIITKQLRPAEKAALFLCTIGPQVENWVKELMSNNDYMVGYLADHLASFMVDAAIDVVQDDLEKVAGQTGFSISNRFSPGYCGWHVSQQKAFFEFFPTHNCGISLSDSCLMMPIKSVSGVIGIGKNIKRAPYTCSLCDHENCVYRKK